ncbi:MAG: DUF4956 domain-containing protein [Longimicrobiales bacterium]|nr:DUF4956 domain-containing protein [Longimicrobiales bacterium]
MFARFTTSAWVRLLAYYAFLAAAILGLIQIFPWLEQMLILDLSGIEPAAGLADLSLQQPHALVPELGAVANTLLVAGLGMLGGLLFALPVAWVYMVTKRREGYQKSVVQMVIILPIAVAGVVLVVRGDVALAFALAGIVAAVRFRTTLKDVKDAVFAFVAIGIGLASGIQSWLLAGALSFFFSVVILAMWRYEVGEVYPDFALVAGPVRLSEVLAPGDPDRAITVGEERLTAPLTGTALSQVRDHAERLAHYVKADALRKKGKYRELLLVYADGPDETEAWIEDLIPEYASRWRLVQAFPARHGATTMEYLVRFKNKAEIGEFLHRLREGRGAELVRAAELQSVRGLRRMLT